MANNQVDEMHLATKIVIILFIITVISPLLGHIIVKISNPRGDAAGVGMATGFLYLGTILISGIVSGIVFICLWIFYPEPMPIWVKIMGGSTFFIPFVFIIGFEYVIHWISSLKNK